MSGSVLNSKIVLRTRVHRNCRLNAVPQSTHINRSSAFRTAFTKTTLIAASFRASPSPEVTDLLCRLPLSTLTYALEATNPGDLMRCKYDSMRDVWQDCWDFNVFDEVNRTPLVGASSLQKPSSPGELIQRSVYI